ncbi:MAG: hypothetical protein R3F44_03785 [Candidatus Competibacteraceae bacterium]
MAALVLRHLSWRDRWQKPSALVRGGTGRGSSGGQPATGPGRPRHLPATWQSCTKTPATTRNTTNGRSAPVKQFPDDPQVLLAAVATATARKAYKKSRRFRRAGAGTGPDQQQGPPHICSIPSGPRLQQILAGKHELATRN